jgi:hypothetical protein
MARRVAVAVVRLGDMDRLEVEVGTRRASGRATGSCPDMGSGPTHCTAHWRRDLCCRPGESRPVDHLTVDVSRVHIPAVPEEHAAVRGALHLVRSRRRGLRDSGGVCGQKLGRRGAPKGGHHDVTERQAHGSQPVRVRSGETPGSPVAALPASSESPGSKRRKTVPGRGRATGQSAASSEACSVVRDPAQAGQEGAEPVVLGRRPWTAPENLERVPKNPPA